MKVTYRKAAYSWEGKCIHIKTHKVLCHIWFMNVLKCTQSPSRSVKNEDQVKIKPRIEKNLAKNPDSLPHCCLRYTAIGHEYADVMYLK